jgi:hypothetical protein
MADWDLDEGHWIERIALTKVPGGRIRSAELETA